MAFRSQAGQVAVMHRAVTPSDTVNYTDGTARALYVGGAGNIVIVDPTGEAITYAALPGDIFEIASIRVNNTNTTATSIVAWF